MFALKKSGGSLKRFITGSSRLRIWSWAIVFIALNCPLRGGTIAILSPGSTISPVPDFEDANLDNGSFTVSAFGTGLSPTGELETTISASPLNPFGSQYLVFSYAISLEVGDVVQLSFTGFSGFETAVKMSSDAADGFLPALDVSRSSDGNSVTFDFSGIPGGAFPGGGYYYGSASLDVYTNALSSTDPTATVVNSGGASAQVDVPGPSDVPEPSSISLACLSLGVCAVFRRRLSHL